MIEIVVAIITAMSAFATAWLANRARNTSVERAAKRNGWDHLVAHMERECKGLTDQLISAKHEIHELADILYETKEEAAGTEMMLNARIRELERELKEMRNEGEQVPKKGD